MEVIRVVYMLKCVILAKYNSCDQTCIRGEKTTAGECCGRTQPSHLLQRCQGPPRTHLLTLGSFSHHSSTSNALSLYQLIKRRNGLPCAFYSVYLNAFLVYC